MTINEKIKKLVGYNMKIEQLLLKVTKHENDNFNLKEVEGYTYIPKYILYSSEKEGLLNEFDVFQTYKIIFNNFNFVFEVIEDEGDQNNLNQLNILKRLVNEVMNE